MKIHFLLAKDFFRGGGIETYTREVGRRLVARGHEVTVYSTRGEEDCIAEWQGMRFVWLPKAKPYWAEKTAGALVAACNAFRQDIPDIFHLHSVVAGTLALFLHWKKAPCVVQMHGIERLRTRWGFIAKGVLKIMERLSLVSADAVTAVSRTQCKYFKDTYNLDCEFIPTAADLKEFAQPNLILDLGITPRKYILFAARLVPEKGVHYLIEAFRTLSLEHTLIIAGEAPAPGYERKLHEMAQDDPRIRFLGRVRGRLLEELFSNAALFAQPSELEGLSIGLLEAMSYGIPCLASDIPENLEVVGERGFLFRNKDVADLRRQLSWALANQSGLSNLAAYGRQRVQEHFAWERVVDQLETLYKRVSVSIQPESDPGLREAALPRTPHSRERLL